MIFRHFKYLIKCFGLSTLGLVAFLQHGLSAEPTTLRVATFNTSLSRDTEGQLLKDLQSGQDQQIKNIAEIIQRTAPDVILLNEFDYDPTGTSYALFQEKYLGVDQNGAKAVQYPHVFFAPSNTGVTSGKDLDNNGKIDGGNDAFGFGKFPGHYGMVVLSKFPLDSNKIRTFQNFLWKNMPDAMLPDNPKTPAPKDWYAADELDVLRLSSKSHWDIPVIVKDKVVHILASHPTPPVFDGPEDKNGTRNHDEIRFWVDYLTPGKNDYITDDKGNTKGLEANEAFVLLGDLNADPQDGDSTQNPIKKLLSVPSIVADVIPESKGGEESAKVQGKTNLEHKGNPKHDTGDFSEPPGNLRVDYVLPSKNFKIKASGVFWPDSTDPLYRLVNDYKQSSDHRLVWLDLEWKD